MNWSILAALCRFIPSVTCAQTFKAKAAVACENLHFVY